MCLNKLIEIIKAVPAKLTNTNIMIAVMSGICQIIINCGFQINDTKILLVANGICSLGVLLGIMTKTGQESTKWNK